MVFVIGLSGNIICTKACVTSSARLDVIFFIKVNFDFKRGDTYYAIASYPFHRPSYREVETLGYSVENFATEPKPLHAVYLLEKSEPDAMVEIKALKGIEKFKAFHYSSFIDFEFMKQERFTFFTQMAKHIPVYQVKVPWDLARLDEVYEKIVLNTQE